MAKIIKSPALEIYHIKALMPYWGESTQGTSEKSPYRIIAARPNMSLHIFGIAVLNAFDFDYDHLFGFYDNVKRYYASKMSYEHPESIQDNQDDWSGFGSRNVDKLVRNMDDHPISDIFTRRNKKWLMLFDYGDEWMFWVSLEKKVQVVHGEELPKVIESKYDAPEQYPDFEEGVE